MENNLVNLGSEASVEKDTTVSSQDIKQTVSDEEISKVATSEQPSDENTSSRAQERIQELSRKLKETRKTAEYWEALASNTDVPSKEVENDLPLDQELTVEEAARLGAKEVLKELESRERVAIQSTAKKQMAEDAIKTLEKYPELETDNDLANMVYSLAYSQGISMESSADIVMSRISKITDTERKNVMATQAAKLGGSVMGSGSVSNGIAPTIDLSKMTREEKEANWKQILAQYSQE